MPEEKGSYILLYRRLIDSPEWKSLTDAGFKVMITILLSCSWHDSDVMIDGRIRTLKPGQWLISFRRLAEISGVSLQQTRTAIEVLKLTHFLTQEITQDKKQILSVNNWKNYQLNLSPTQHPTQKLTDEQHTDNTPITQFLESNKDIQVEKDLKALKDLSSKSTNISTDDDESNQIYKNIFDYWNTRNETLHHRKFAGTIRDRIIKSINGRVEEGYTEQDIITSIKNYCDVLRNPDQFFKHQWPLDIFLSRSNGFINFIDSARPWDKWLVDKPKGQKVQEQNRALVEKLEREERLNGFGNYEEGNVIDINQDCGDF